MKINLLFENNKMILLVDNSQVNVTLNEVSQKLLNATDDLRKDYIISPSGTGIHWPKLDEDLSVRGLISQFGNK